MRAKDWGFPVGLHRAGLNGKGFMTESAKDLIEKTIREYNDKIHAKVQELHRKQVNRERYEAELVEAKVEIENLESFVTILVESLTTIDDRVIMAGLKSQRRLKRGVRKHSQPQGS